MRRPVSPLWRAAHRKATRSVEPGYRGWNTKSTMSFRTLPTAQAAIAMATNSVAPRGLCMPSAQYANPAPRTPPMNPMNGSLGIGGLGFGVGPHHPTKPPRTNTGTITTILLPSCSGPGGHETTNANRRRGTLSHRLNQRRQRGAPPVPEISASSVPDDAGKDHRGNVDVIQEREAFVGLGRPSSLFFCRPFRARAGINPAPTRAWSMRLPASVCHPE